MTNLIYCADGNRKFAEIALRYGFLYGAQLPNTVYYPPVFVDQNWRKPVRDKYMAALVEHRPALATVLDWEHESQLCEVMAWAEEAAQLVTEAVIIIPKVMSGIPRLPRTLYGKQVRLGYSVPTSFAGTQLPLWEFTGWPIHLLGGSPSKQLELARYLDVRSVDGNYSQKMALQYGQFYAAGGQARYANNRHWPKLNESPSGHIEQDIGYVAFELSCRNIRAAWLGCAAMIRYAIESDLEDVKKIANQYKQELGYVMVPALRESIQRRTLLIAEYAGRIVGFVNYRACRDGWHTIHEIAVRRDCLKQRIGAGLLAAVPRPTRLKCTVDNARANAFYERAGMQLTGTERGRKRALNVWQLPV